MHNTFEYFLAFESSGDRNYYTFKIKTNNLRDVQTPERT